MLNSFLCSFFAAVLLAFSFLPVALGQINDLRCRLDFYFIPGCDQCRQIEQDTFSQLRELFGDRVLIRKHNLYDPAEYAEMIKTRAALNVKKEDNVFFIVAGQIYVGGIKDIRENLIPTVEGRLSSGFQYTVSSQAVSGHAGGDAFRIHDDHSFPYSFAVILVGGLIDGVNPCAFAVIVFLVTSLLAGGGRREKLFSIGLGFCSAVYLTYFLLGLGLFQVFRLSFARIWLGNLLNMCLISGLIIMAFVSFRDAFFFRRTGRQDGIVLKLPGGITRIIHKLIRSNLSSKHYFAGSFLLGCFVTVLESVCTGQLYVPVLAFLARESQLKINAICGLALYNFMFILPLIMVFFIAHYGARYLGFIAWSRRNFFRARCAAGLFFILLAVLLYLA